MGRHKEELNRADFVRNLDALGRESLEVCVLRRGVLRLVHRP